MKHPAVFPTALTVFVVLAGTRTLSGQILPSPTFRPSDAPERGARLLAGIGTIDADLSAVRRVLIDTTTGTLAWVEFDPGAMARTQVSETPEGAAMTLLTTYGVRLFGAEIGPADIELMRTNQDYALTHLRYAQRYRGRPVYGGDLVIHLRRLDNGYAVQSANGRLYPGIDIPSDPAVSFDAARVAALGAVAGARAGDTQDSSIIIVPHGSGYQLAYRVYLHDPTAGSVIRYVDALSGSPFAETRAVQTWSEGSFVNASDPGQAASDVLQPAHKSMAGYVSTTGVDALDQPRGPFNVWQNSGTQFSMLSNGWPGVTAIEIRDFLGALFGTDDCSTYHPYVQATSITSGWPQDDGGKEEVSAVANMGETLRYYNTKFGRRGIRNEQLLHPARGCVHATSNMFNAAYFPGNGTWVFGPGSADFKPAAAAQDVVTHELAHGVQHIDASWPEYTSTENGAVGEAHSDYYGTRHRGSSCLAFDALNQCLREINSDLTVAQREQICGTDFHCLGVAFSSGLWQTASLPGEFGYDTDWAVYNGIRYYMTSTVEFATGREAIVRAAKDFLRQGFNRTENGIVYDLEREFFEHGIGPEPVGVGVPHASFCNEWRPEVSGADSRSFALWFEAGAGYFNDWSVDHRFYNLSLGTYTGTSLSMFTSAQLGGHTVNDGHDHAFRFRFTDVGPAVGYLDYFAPGNNGCGIQQAAADSSDVALPTQFAVRQAVQTEVGLLTSRVASPGGTARSAAAAPSQAGSLAAEVRRFGITTLEVDIPAHMAQQRLEVRIHDLQGRPVRTLAEDRVPAGRRVVAWDRVTEAGAPAPAGVYVVVVSYGGQRTRTHFVITPTR